MVTHTIHWAVCVASMVDHCLGSPFDGWLNHFGLGSFPLQDSWGRPWIPNLYATDSSQNICFPSKALTFKMTALSSKLALSLDFVSLTVGFLKSTAISLKTPEVVHSSFHWSPVVIKRVLELAAL